MQLLQGDGRADADVAVREFDKEGAGGAYADLEEADRGSGADADVERYCPMLKQTQKKPLFARRPAFCPINTFLCNVGRVKPSIPVGATAADFLNPD